MALPQRVKIVEVGPRDGPQNEKEFVPTAILSRQVAVIRKGTLILNLPGQPKSIRETLEGLRDAQGKAVVAGIFAAVPYCIDLIGGPYIETRPEVVAAFRPKNAIRPPKS